MENFDYLASMEKGSSPFQILSIMCFRFYFTNLKIYITLFIKFKTLSNYPFENRERDGNE